MKENENSPGVLASSGECNRPPGLNGEAVVLSDDHKSSEKHEEVAKDLGLSEGETSWHLNFKFLRTALFKFISININ